MIKITIISNTSTSRIVTDMINTNVSDLNLAMQRVRDDIMDSNYSTRLTSMDINPDLSVHYLYREQNIQLIKLIGYHSHNFV